MSNFDESKVRREQGKFANKDSMRDEPGQVALEPSPHDKADDVESYLRSVGSNWADSMAKARSQGAKKPLAQWLKNHDVVDTVQARRNPSTGKMAGWTPGPREVDLSAATYAEFDGSRRDYAGVVSLYADDETWVGFDKDMGDTLVYRSL